MLKGQSAESPSRTPHASTLLLRQHDRSGARTPCCETAASNFCQPSRSSTQLNHTLANGYVHTNSYEMAEANGAACAIFSHHKPGASTANTCIEYHWWKATLSTLPRSIRLHLHVRHSTFRRRLPRHLHSTSCPLKHSGCTNAFGHVAYGLSEAWIAPTCIVDTCAGSATTQLLARARAKRACGTLWSVTDRTDITSAHTCLLQCLVCPQGFHSAAYRPPTRHVCLAFSLRKTLL
jgi:hypothetical protein